MYMHVTVRSNQYRDSVRLMQISREAGALPGVAKVLALLGTEGNKKVLADLGMLDDAASAATASDLLICVEAEDAEAAGRAVAEVDARLSTASAASEADGDDSRRPGSLEAAVARLPGANFAMISLPGQFAKLDVLTALDQGLNVMLFSDNMSMEDERELKELAVSKDLLLMGPDCGTAIVGGVALALANIVRRGSIGIAAASGTGIQEVTCLVDRFGGGISHAIGVGGRDLRRDIGGLMMCQAIRTLGRDPGTRTLVLLSKPGDPDVMDRVLEEARATGLDVVACLLGADESRALPGMKLVSTLEDAAFAALGLAVPEPEATPALRARVAGLSPERRHLRGLFSGGTLCYETLFLLRNDVAVESNVAVDPALKLHPPARGLKHFCMDLGEDEFTVGRPHPIIDLGLRLEWLERDMADPTVKVELLDIVLGYGANRDPAGELAGFLAEAGRKAPPDGGPVILAHVCGTDADPQRLAEQERKLEEAGVFLFPTNAQAAKVASLIVRGKL